MSIRWEEHTLPLYASSLWTFGFFLLRNNMKCSASHIPGLDNYIANSFSRSGSIPHDYSLDPNSFSDLMSFITFPLGIDLFASHLTHKLDLYVSWKADPFAMKFNAFSFKWLNNIYMFLPIPLINKTIIDYH